MFTFPQTPAGVVIGKRSSLEGNGAVVQWLQTSEVRLRIGSCHCNVPSDGKHLITSGFEQCGPGSYRECGSWRADCVSCWLRITRCRRLSVGSCSRISDMWSSGRFPRRKPAAGSWDARRWIWRCSTCSWRTGCRFRWRMRCGRVEYRWCSAPGMRRTAAFQRIGGGHPGSRSRTHWGISCDRSARWWRASYRAGVIGTRERHAARAVFAGMNQTGGSVASSNQYAPISCMAAVNVSTRTGLVMNELQCSA